MPASCFHEKPGSIRKFKRGRIVFFGIQCPDCLKLVGPKIRPDQFEAGGIFLHPNEIPLAEFRPSFQGGGNSKRKKYAAYLRSSAWKQKRSQRLELDGYVCQKCEDVASEAHHLTYENFGHERMEDLQSLCKDCHRTETEGRFT